MPDRNKQLFEDAQNVLVGGVDSPVRAFKSVGGTPVFIRAGQGPYMEDENGKRYIDYVLSWGPMILGHAHPDVVKSVTDTLKTGSSFGAPSRLEIELAKAIQKWLPSCEKIRFVSSGTEAVMGAIRLARGFTGRNKIIKFTGCYHGHADGLLIAAGSGNLTLGKPDSAGIPDAFTAETIGVDFNDRQGVRQAFKTYGTDIAGIIVEPVCGNMGVVPPEPGFLDCLREECDRHGALLIFDEVMTGFRVAMTGAQGHFGIKPDLTCLGKVIGGGFPCAAFGGRQEIMDHLAPVGPVYQAGTLSGNPIAMSAGIATLTALSKPGVFETAMQNTQALAEGIRSILQKTNHRYQLQTIGTMWTLFFTDKPVRNLAEVKTCDSPAFNRFFHAILAAGIYLPPSQFEAAFLSSAHTPEDIQTTLSAIEKSL